MTSTPEQISLSWEERIKLAENPNTPVEILKVLATDKNSSVRWEVAENPNYKSETLTL